VIRWLFWDLGDVILNEEHLRFTFYERLFRFIRKQKSEFLFSDLMEIRKEIIRVKQSISPLMDIARSYLPEGEHHKFKEEIHYFYKRYSGKYIKVVPRMTPVLQILKKEYKLGIIANQPVFIRPLLDRLNLSAYFSAIYISDQVNIRKPDERIFRLALEEQKVTPEEAVYIGNRIDHDMIPAMNIGMSPLQARFNPDVKGFVPSTTYEKQYYNAVNTVSEWPETTEMLGYGFPGITHPEEILKLDLNNLQVAFTEPEAEPLTLSELLKKFLLGG